MAENNNLTPKTEEAPSRNNDLVGIYITQAVLILVTVFGFWFNWNLNKESKQKELETELILNAYTLSDSTQQINRLKTFCDLVFFSEERKTIINDKIKSGKIYFKRIEQPYNRDLNKELQVITNYTNSMVFYCGSNYSEDTTNEYSMFHLNVQCDVLNNCNSEVIATRRSEIKNIRVCENCYADLLQHLSKSFDRLRYLPLPKEKETD